MPTIKLYSIHYITTVLKYCQISHAESITAVNCHTVKPSKTQSMHQATQLIVWFSYLNASNHHELAAKSQSDTCPVFNQQHQQHYYEID